MSEEIAKEILGEILDKIKLTSFLEILKDLSMNVNNNSEVNEIVNKENKFEKKVKKTLEYFNIKYKDQPNGKQNPPDYHLKFKYLGIIKLECKSAEGWKPLWNCTIPSNDTIYLFRKTKNIKKTFVFIAEDIITNDEREYLKNVAKKMKNFYNNMDKKFQNRWDYYPRNMFNQKISFKNLSKEDLYNNVISWINKL